MGPDLAVVVHRGTGVDQAVLADAGAGLNDGAGHDLRAFAQDHAAGHHGGGMDHLGEAIAFGLEAIEQGGPVAGAVDGPDAVDQVDRSGGMIQDRIVAGQEIDFRRQGRRALRVLSAAADDSRADALQCLDQNPRMAAGTEHDDR